MGIEEEIQEIEDEISETPKNKATEEHLGRLKAKLSKLKEEKEKRESSSGGGSGYAPPKAGDATVVLAGFPSVGKSTLLNDLTNADSEVGSYEFTTLEVVPGMMNLNGADVQMLDVPGLIGGAGQGRGQGKEVLSVVRTADLVLMVTDVYSPDKLTRLQEELHDVGIRLDQEPPKVSLQPRGRGGIDIRSTVDLDLGEETMKAVLRENGFLNGIVTVQEELDIDRFIDAVMDNRVYLPSLTVFNKKDLAEESYLETLRKEHDGDPIFVSAETGDGLEDLKERMEQELCLMRIYMKPPKKDPDYDDPLVLPEGATVSDAAKKIHRNVADRFDWARVWGPSAKHDGQQVGSDHVLRDGDVLTVST